MMTHSHTPPTGPLINTLSAADQQAMRWATAGSVLMALLLLVIKSFASSATGSSALLASLGDTALDLIASLVTFFAVRVALTPPDHDHRFGHGKAEALAGLFQAFLILASALALIGQCLWRWQHPQPLADIAWGVSASLIAMALTLVLVGYQRWVVRRTGSVAIAADSLHYIGDVALNAVVIAALLLDGILPKADTLGGLLVALVIARGAWLTGKRAIDMLMDKEWPPEDRNRIIALALQDPQVLGVHELRTRTSGLDQFVQFHIWVKATLTVREAHAIQEALEQRLHEAFPGTEFLIHADPEGHIDPYPTVDEVHLQAR